MIQIDRTLHRGDILIAHRRLDGTVDQYLVRNAFTDGGLGYLAARAAGEAVDVISHMALGEGDTPEDGTSTTLEAEIAGSRVAVSITGTGPSRIYTAVFGETVGNGAITEAGLFNAATGGLLTNRAVFGVKTKVPGEIMTFVWTLSQQRA
jgi:hypothetical protein